MPEISTCTVQTHFPLAFLPSAHGLSFQLLKAKTTDSALTGLLPPPYLIQEETLFGYLQPSPHPSPVTSLVQTTTAPFCIITAAVTLSASALSQGPASPRVPAALRSHLPSLCRVKGRVVKLSPGGPRRPSPLLPTPPHRPAPARPLLLWSLHFRPQRQESSPPDFCLAAPLLPHVCAQTPPFQCHHPGSPYLLEWFWPPRNQGSSAAT